MSPRYFGEKILTAVKKLCNARVKIKPCPELKLSGGLVKYLNGRKNFIYKPYAYNTIR